MRSFIINQMVQFRTQLDFRGFETQPVIGFRLWVCFLRIFAYAYTSSKNNPLFIIGTIFKISLKRKIPTRIWFLLEIDLWWNVLKSYLTNNRNIMNNNICLKVVNSPNECNALITDRIYRTWKFLAAVAKGLPIISCNWLYKVLKSKKIIPFDNYIIDDKSFEEKFKFKLKNSLSLAQEKPIFNGYAFYITANTKPTPDELSNIIKCAGGTIIKSISSLNKNNEYKFYIISDIKDKKCWNKLQTYKPSAKFINTEAIMQTILKQFILLNEHVLF